LHLSTIMINRLGWASLTIPATSHGAKRSLKCVRRILLK
jgi:hypothetical protein